MNPIAKSGLVIKIDLRERRAVTGVQKKAGNQASLPGTFYFCHSNQCNAIIIILVNIHYHHITIIIHMHRQVLKHNGAQCPFSGACFKIHILADVYYLK